MSTTPKDWPTIRAAWDMLVNAGVNVTITGFGETHGVTRETLSRRMNADKKAGNPWPLPQKKSPEPDASNVVNLADRRRDVTGRRVDSPRPGGGRDRGKSRDESQRREAEAAGLGDHETDLGDAAVDLLETNDLQTHDVLGGLLLTAARRTLRRYIAGRITPGVNQSVADVFNSVVTGTKNAVMLSRAMAGVAPGDASSADANTPQAVTIKRVVMQPEKIPVDEKGRQIPA